MYVWELDPTHPDTQCDLLWPNATVYTHDSSDVRDIKKIFSALRRGDSGSCKSSFYFLDFIAVAAPRRLGTRAVGFDKAAPERVVMAPLGLGWGWCTGSVTEELHPMPSWPFRAAAVGLQLVAWLGTSS
jgi:hypothetical protein